jgi:alkylglycerol monooxygenase
MQSPVFPDFTAFVIPVFLLFTGIEYAVSRLQKKKYFTFESSVINLSVGIAERAMNLFILGLFYGIFEHIQKHYGLFDIENNLRNGIILFIAVDFVWYWYHRLGHEVNILWSAHVVHHQSEEFNYTVSARVTLFQAFWRNAFWCVLPLIGFSADSIALCLLIHGIYPFFIHTRTIGKLGILELIFVTPSHHRVHHASNEVYLDKNYGDVLILWDRLFNTFIEETEAPVFGLTKPLESRSFLWQHFHQLLELIDAVKAMPGTKQKIQMIFGPPSGIAPDIRDRLESVYLTGRTRKDKSKTPRLRYYVAAQLGVSLLLLFVLTLAHAVAGLPLIMLSTLFILLTLVNCGAILEKKQWVFYPECARLMLLLLMASFYFPHPLTWAALVFLPCAAACYFNDAQRRFISLLYGHPLKERRGFAEWERRSS